MKVLKFAVFLAISTTVLLGAEAWASEKARSGSPEKGKILYNKLRCYYCHRIGNEGGNTGPDLTTEGTKKRGMEWQMRNLADPSSTHLRHPENMPKFDRLTEKMFLDLAAYLESLK
ncbi:MAG: c-type cytochrome [Nitrospirae bacterium]|nr:c-type cytochrome [Nitrospirota bacterium]